MDKIRHIGNISAVCGCGLRTSMREDLELKRYQRMGKTAADRFRDESPYRICLRIAVIRRRETW